MNPGGPSRAPRDPAECAAAGISRIEGYLLAQSERARAAAEAEAFADRLPWLTSAQRDEVVRHYRDARTDLARQQLGVVAHRCAELREEYEQRYRALAERLLRRSLATALTALALAVAVLALLGGNPG